MTTTPLTEQGILDLLHVFSDPGEIGPFFDERGIDRKVIVHAGLAFAAAAAGDDPTLSAVAGLFAAGVVCGIRLVEEGYTVAP